MRDAVKQKKDKFVSKISTSCNDIYSTYSRRI